MSAERPEPRAAAAAGLLALLAVAGGATRAGAETALDRYQELLREKRGLLRENALLNREAELAATKSPYVVFHLPERRLDFKIRGKTLKSYSLHAVADDELGLRSADAEVVWEALVEPLTVREKEGGHPELIPPDPETGRQAGLVYSDPNQLAAARGMKPVDTDAGLLGVDVPTDYYIRFEENVVFHVRTARDLSFREKALDRLGRIAERMRAALPGRWGGEELGGAGRPRLELYLTADLDTAKRLHYSLLPGEQIVIAPPPPPPVQIVSSGRVAGASSETASR